MISKYFNFFNTYKLFEATEAEAKKLSEEFIFRNYKARELAFKKLSNKKTLLSNEGLTNEEFQDFLKLSNEEIEAQISNPKIEKMVAIKKTLATLKLTEEEEKEVLKRSHKDPYYLRLKEILSENLEWLEFFTRLFFTHFKNYKIDPNEDYELIESLIGSFSVRNSKFIWSENDFGSIGSNYNKLKNLPGNLQKDILKKFPDYIKHEKENWKSSITYTNNSASEKLSDDIRDISENKNVESLIERLPRGYCVKDGKEIKSNNNKIIQDEESCSLLNGEIKYNLYEDFKKLDSNSELKTNIINAFKLLISILQERNISIKPVINSNKIVSYPYESIFKIRIGTSTDPQTDKSLENFYNRLSGTLKGFDNSSASKLIDDVISVNDQFGENRGTEIVWNNDDVIVINVKSHKANHYLHNINNGESIRTKHCIAYDSSSYWDDRLSGQQLYNKLYYVYNFKLNKTNPLFPFGVIITPSGTIHSAHDREDSYIAGDVKQICDSYGIPFSVLAPISEEEKLILGRSKSSSEKIILPGISLNDLKEYVNDGANINIRNGIVLQNAIRENDLEKVKFILNNGGDFEIGQAYTLAKNLEIIIELIKAGLSLRKVPKWEKLFDIKYLNIIALTKDIFFNNNETNREVLTENKVYITDKLIEYALRDNNFDYFQGVIENFLQPLNIKYITKSDMNQILYEVFNKNVNQNFYIYILNKFKELYPEQIKKIKNYLIHTIEDSTEFSPLQSANVMKIVNEML